MDNIVNPEIIEENGSVNISDEVVAVMASLAAEGVSGVASMSGGMAVGIAELIGKKNFSKGVKITKNENALTLDLSLVVEYGSKIPDVAWEVQDKVKSEIETMTGLTVAGVNVSVDGISVPAEENVTVKESETTETANEKATEE